MINKPGKYVVIEGHDGTGKSTQVEMIREWLKTEHGIDSIEIHEPAGNPIADEIRTILKNGEIPRDDGTDVLLFTAARNDLWKNNAIPAIKSGKWVISARSYLSTIAYQGYGAGYDINLIEMTTDNFLGRKYSKPDYEFILDLEDEQERSRRISARGKLETKDTYESKPSDFQDRVRQGYLKIAHDRNVPIISANQSPKAINKDIQSLIAF